MRAKSIAAVLALGVALLAVPAGAGAKPGFYKRPGYSFAETLISAPHGTVVQISASDGKITLGATRPIARDGLAGVTYTRPLGRSSLDRLHLDMGRAGKVDLRFVAEGTERETDKNCNGDPAIFRTGHFVGTISFHPPGGFIDLDLDRSSGAVVRFPPQVCRGHFPAALRDYVLGIRRLIAGEPEGRRHFEAVTLPPLQKGEEHPATYSATVTRQQGSLTITDQAQAQRFGEDNPFFVPDLDALPATATVEPPAPFTGAATFDLPSRRTATLSGNLAVELPEVGRVPLVGPKIDSGVCHGFSCTSSLPKALRPQHSGGFFSVSVAEAPPEAPTE